MGSVTKSLCKSSMLANDERVRPTTEMTSSASAKARPGDRNRKPNFIVWPATSFSQESGSFAESDKDGHPRRGACAVTERDGPAPMTVPLRVCRANLSLSPYVTGQV